MLIPIIKESETRYDELLASFRYDDHKDSGFGPNSEMNKLRRKTSSDLEKEIKSNLMVSQLALLEGLKKEVEIIETEYPSNYPTPEGQEAVYGTCGRLINILEESITYLKNIK